MRPSVCELRGDDGGGRLAFLGLLVAGSGGGGGLVSEAPPSVESSISSCWLGATLRRVVVALDGRRDGSCKPIVLVPGVLDVVTVVVAVGRWEAGALSLQQQTMPVQANALFGPWPLLLLVRSLVGS
jgi:hypothetical protein